jgi:hypothetical protein
MLFSWTFSIPCSGPQVNRPSDRGRSNGFTGSHAERGNEAKNHGITGSHALRGNRVFTTLCVDSHNAERCRQCVPTQSVGTRLKIMESLVPMLCVGTGFSRRSASIRATQSVAGSAFPRRAWERGQIMESLVPMLCVGTGFSRRSASIRATQSVAGSAFPRRAWERGQKSWKSTVAVGSGLNAPYIHSDAMRSISLRGMPMSRTCRRPM